MNTKNVHVIRVPTITRIVMLFSILMCMLNLYIDDILLFNESKMHKLFKANI